MDGAEEQGSVGLVDQHREPGVPRCARVLLLESQVGGVPVVAVGEEALAAGDEVPDARDVLLVPHGPEPLALSGPVEVAPVRLGARDLVDEVPELLAAVVHQEDGCGVEVHLQHPVGQLAGLLRVDRLVRPDRAVGQRVGTLGHAQGADESPDGEAAGGVLVEVERGCAVSTRVAAVDPLGEALGDVAVGSRQCSRGGGVAHAGRGQHHRPEREQREGLRHVRRHDGGEVHRSIVGGRSSQSGKGWTMLEESATALVEAHDLVMFDLDGVVYVGGEAIDGVAAVIDRVRESGRHVAFVTNNASRTPDQVAAKLTQGGCVGRGDTTWSPPPRPRRGCWSRSTARVRGC